MLSLAVETRGAPGTVVCGGNDGRGMRRVDEDLTFDNAEAGRF